MKKLTMADRPTIRRLSGAVTGSVKLFKDGRVRVEVTDKELEAGGHEVLANCAVLKGMREAGVPVVGRISIQGVRHGRMRHWYEAAFNQYVIEWERGPDSPAEVDPAAGL